MKKILLLLALTLSTLISAQMGVVQGLDRNGDGFLSLRKKPKAKEIGKLYNGDKVKILDKRGKYYKVKDIKSSRIGWAHGNWIKKIKSNNLTYKTGSIFGLDPNGDGFLSLRKKPKGREIGKLYNGDEVKILNKSGKYYKVKDNKSSKIGWAHGNWIKINKVNLQYINLQNLSNKNKLKRSIEHIKIPTNGYSAPFLERGHDDAVELVKIYKNYILTVASDGIVKVWSTKNFKLLKNIPYKNSFLDGKKISELFKEKNYSYINLANMYKTKTRQFEIDAYNVKYNDTKKSLVVLNSNNKQLYKTPTDLLYQTKFAINRSVKHNITNVICGTNVEAYLDYSLTRKLYSFNYITEEILKSNYIPNNDIRCYPGTVGDIDMDLNEDIIVLLWTERGEFKVFSRISGQLLKHVNPNDYDDEERDSMAGAPGLSGLIKPQSIINNKNLYVGGNKTRLWDISTGQLTNKLKQSGKIIGANDRFFAVGSTKKGNIHIYDTKTNKKITSFKGCANASGLLTKIGISSDYLVYSCVIDKSTDWTSKHRGYVKVIDLKTMSTIKKYNGFYAEDYEPTYPIKPFYIVNSKLFIYNIHRVLEIFDLNTKKTLNKYEINNKTYSFKVDNEYVYFLSLDKNNNNYVDILSWNNRNIKYVKAIPYSDFKHIPLSNDLKFYTKVFSKNEIELYSSKGRKHIATFNYIRKEDWLTITPEGYFNGSAGAVKHLNITKYTKNGMEPFDFSQLYDHFFRPDLVKLKLSGDDEAFQKATNGLTYQDALKNPPPKLLFKFIDNKETKTSGFEYKAVETKKEKVNLTFNVKEHDGGGVGLIRIYQEGKLIQTIGEGKVNKQSANVDAILEQEKLDSTLKENQKTYIASLSKSIQGDISIEDTIAKVQPKKTTNQSGTYELEVELKSGKNEISIEAFNKTNTVTSYRENITINADIPKQKPKLYAIVAGVNEFEAPSVNNLKYSQNDAKAIKEAAEKKMKTVFDGVEVIYLTGKEVTKENILKAAQEISKKAKLDDTVLFYISTHGRAARGKLYLVPYNNKSVKNWIDFEQTFQAVQSIKALNQIFIIDACESGKANDIVSSVYDSRASVLAKSSGVHMLLATTKGTSAFEHPDPTIKNGVFTHRILEAMKDTTTDANKDSLISILELSKKLKEPTNIADYQYPVIRNVGKDVELERVAN